MGEPMQRLQLPIILIVDDEDGVRRALERQLSDLAIVITAEGGERALEIAAQVRVDLIVSDYRMPGMDGLALLARMAEIDPESRRVLFSSGDVPGVDEYEARGVVHAFVQKPWSQGGLRQIVASLLARPGRGALPSSERRRARRVRTSLRAVYAARGIDPCDGASVDLSRGGARIRGGALVRVGDLVDVTIERDGGPGVAGIAQVVWSARAGSAGEFGVRFLEFREPESRRRLAHWVGEPQADWGTPPP